MNYTDKTLKKLSSSLVFPKSGKHYDQKSLETLRQIAGKDADLPENADLLCDLTSMDWVFDLSEIVNDLAEQLLEERAKTKDFIFHAKRDFSNFIKLLEAKA